MALEFVDTHSVPDAGERENSEGFRFLDVKNKFISYVRNEPTPRDMLNCPWSSPNYNTIVGAIKEVMSKKDQGTLSVFQTQIMSKYKLVVEDSKEVLLLKPTNPTEPTKRVLNNEECFDILAKVHLETMHGDYNTMASAILSKYVTSKSNIHSFLKLCNVCAKRQATLEKEQERRYYHAFTIDMRNFRDEPYDFLLVLVDISISFVILRPLVAYEAPEVSLELIKFMSDFGPPIAIKVDFYEVNLFKPALEIVTKLCPYFDVMVDLMDKQEIVPYEDEIKCQLMQWIEKTACLNWATGCRMVQWMMNNTDYNGITPYKSLFGENPVMLFNPLPMWNKINSAATGRKLADNFGNIFNINRNKNKPNKEGLSVRKPWPTHKVTVPMKCVTCHMTVEKINYCSVCNGVLHSVCTLRKVKYKNVYLICSNCNKLREDE